MRRSTPSLLPALAVLLLALSPGSVAQEAPPSLADDRAVEAAPGPDAPAAAPSAERSSATPEAIPGAVEPAPEPAPLDDPGRTVRGDRVGFAGEIEVPAGTVRRGDVVSIGGSVRVDGTVLGSVIVVGGEVAISGRVSHDLVAVFSATQLGAGAAVDGSLVSVLGSLDDGGARIGHDLVDVPVGLRWPGLEGPLQVLATLWLWSKLVAIVLVFLGILVLAALAPERVDRLADETARRALLALVVGAPTFLLGVPVVLLLLVASVVGLFALPVAVLALAVLVWLGYAGLFLHVGRRIGRTLGREMSVLGGMLLGFAVFAVIWFVPLLGTVVWTVLTWIATGLLITGRLGAGRRTMPVPPPGPSGSP